MKRLELSFGHGSADEDTGWRGMCEICSMHGWSVRLNRDFRAADSGSLRAGFLPDRQGGVGYLTPISGRHLRIFHTTAGVSDPEAAATSVDSARASLWRWNIGDVVRVAFAVPSNVSKLTSH